MPDQMFTVRRDKVTDRVYVVHTASGERWCEVLGSVDVSRERRGHLLVAAIRTLLAVETVLGRTVIPDTVDQP